MRIAGDFAGLQLPGAAGSSMLPAMLASLVSNLLNVEYWLTNPWLPIISLFSLWMFIDALRRLNQQSA